MLTLGQALCLILGYKPTNENRKRAKEHLPEAGPKAFYFRGQDPMRPKAIVLDILERDSYTFVAYPSTPTLAPTKTSMDNVIEDGDGSTHNSGDNSNKVQNNKYKVIKSADDAKAPQGGKQKFNSPIIPYCKERVLQTMKTIATNVDPNNEIIFNYEFVTSEIQYKIMTDVFPSLHRHCSQTQLQYWVGISQIWPPLDKLKRNKTTIYGWHLWVLRENMRQLLVETNDSLSTYWQYVRANPDIVIIGYARKSVTKETDVSRSHLLQLMVDKLHFRLKCQNIYVSPCCAVNGLILNRDSPPFKNVLASLNGCQGDITNLTNRLCYLQHKVRLGIIDYAGLTTYPEDIINFLTTYPNICEIAIDHDSHVEILSRHQLLENNQVEKFNCRSAPIKRSK